MVSVKLGNFWGGVGTWWTMVLSFFLCSDFAGFRASCFLFLQKVDYTALGLGV